MVDETRVRCRCGQCRVRGLMGPLMIITVGAIFLLGEFTRYRFDELWPLLLIVAGGVLLGQSLASREGHTGSDRRD